jgi:hypothetical protein
MEREELTPENLYRYLRYVQLAAALENEKTGAAQLAGEALEERALRNGASMLATELIKRYGLGPRPEEN